MALPNGTKAKVIKNTTSRFHSFYEGDVVIALGVDYGPNPSGNWQQFERTDGERQWLLDEHFEVIEVKATRVSGEAGSDENLPGKAVYAVVDPSDNIFSTTEDRDYARELKAALGGKRKGVRIFQYAAVKEIR